MIRRSLIIRRSLTGNRRIPPTTTIKFQYEHTDNPTLFSVQPIINLKRDKSSASNYGSLKVHSELVSAPLLNDLCPPNHMDSFCLPPLETEISTLTREQKRDHMQQLAMKLQSLREPKIRAAFLDSNDPSTNNNALMHHARKVVRYYTDPKRVLPLTLSQNSNPNGSQRHYLGPLVLSGPEFCHSLLSTVVLPHFSQANNVTSDQIYALIDMSLQTVQSLGKLSSTSNPRSRTNNNGHDRDEGTRKKMKRSGGGTTMSFGDLAEELLRLIINTPLPIADGKIGYASPPAPWKHKLNHLYNNTLNTWSMIAASEWNPKVAKNAALRAEKLLLDLAMSQKKKTRDQGQDLTNESEHRSTLLEWIEPDIVSFNTTINAWSKSGRYINVMGKKTDATTVTAAERAQAILTLLQDLHDASQGGSCPANDGEILVPNRMSYEAVIQAWSRAIDHEAPNRAMLVLEDMLERYHTFHAQDTNIGSNAGFPPFPSHRTFNSALTTWARSSHVDAIEKVEQIFHHMKQLGEKGFEQAKPDTFAYNALLYAYQNRITSLLQRRDRHGKQHHKAKMLQECYYFCSRMDEIIQEMEDVPSISIDQSTNEMTQPNSITYKIAMLPLIDIGKEMIELKRNQKVSFTIDECASRAEAYLRKLENYMEQHSVPRQSPKLLTIEPLKDLVTLYAASGEHDKAKDVFYILVRWDSLKLFSGLEVDKSVYDDLIELLLHSGGRSNRRPCPKVLNEIETFFGQDDKPFQRSRRITNCIIESHSKLAWSDIRHARRADEIMLETLQLYNESLDAFITARQIGKSKRVDLRPNTFTLHNVLAAYANSCSSARVSQKDKSQAVKRCEEILAMMEAMHDKRIGSDIDPQFLNVLAKVSPNVKAYNLLLNAYASQARNEKNKDDVDSIIEKAEQLLERMDTLFSTGNNTMVKPDNYTYSSIFNILAHSKSPNAKDKAMNMLNKVTNGDFENDIAVFNTALKVIARHGESTVEAVDLLEKIEDGAFSTENLVISPDKYTYSTVMLSLANENSIEAAKKVEELYRRMLGSYENESSKNSRNAKNLQPDIFCYNVVISAWANVGTKEACRRAEEYLDNLLIEKSSNGPNSSSFSSLMKGCAMRSDLEAAIDCERILNKKEECQRLDNSIKIDVTDYNLVVNKFCKNKDPDGGLRVLNSLLNQLEMMDKRAALNLELTVVYNSVMNSYHKLLGKDGSPKVLEVFRMLNSDKRVKANHFTFFVVMSSLATSECSDSFKTANNILQRIIDSHEKGNGDNVNVRLSIDFYNLLFQACEVAPHVEEPGAMSNESPATIAFERFSELQSVRDPSIKPTDETYNHLLGICKNHVRDENRRSELAKRLFYKCCKDGLLTDTSLTLCRHLLSERQFEEVAAELGMGKGVTSISDILNYKHFSRHLRGISKNSRKKKNTERRKR